MAAPLEVTRVASGAGRVPRRLRRPVSLIAELSPRDGEASSPESTGGASWGDTWAVESARAGQPTSFSPRKPAAGAGRGTSTAPAATAGSKLPEASPRAHSGRLAHGSPPSSQSLDHSITPQGSARGVGFPALTPRAPEPPPPLPADIAALTGVSDGPPRATEGRGSFATLVAATRARRASRSETSSAQLAAAASRVTVTNEGTLAAAAAVARGWFRATPSHAGGGSSSPPPSDSDTSGAGQYRRPDPPPSSQHHDETNVSRSSGWEEEGDTPPPAPPGASNRRMTADEAELPPPMLAAAGRGGGEGATPTLVAPVQQQPQQPQPHPLLQIVAGGPFRESPRGREGGGEATSPGGRTRAAATGGSLPRPLLSPAAASAAVVPPLPLLPPQALAPPLSTSPASPPRLSPGRPLPPTPLASAAAAATAAAAAAATAAATASASPPTAAAAAATWAQPPHPESVGDESQPSLAPAPAAAWSSIGSWGAAGAASAVSRRSDRSRGGGSAAAAAPLPLPLRASGVGRPASVLDGLLAARRGGVGGGARSRLPARPSSATSRGAAPRPPLARPPPPHVTGGGGGGGRSLRQGGRRAAGGGGVHDMALMQPPWGPAGAATGAADAPPFLFHEPGIASELPVATLYPWMTGGGAAAAETGLRARAAPPASVFGSGSLAREGAHPHWHRASSSGVVLGGTVAPGAAELPPPVRGHVSGGHAGGATGSSGSRARGPEPPSQRLQSHSAGGSAETSAAAAQQHLPSWALCEHALSLALRA